MFSGFGEVSEILKQIVAEGYEDDVRDFVLEESDEDPQAYLKSVLRGEEE